MPALSVLVLGPPRFELKGAPLRLQRRKVAALLAYLAVTARPHGREALTALLFPEQPAERARADFRQTLSFLKGLVGDEWLNADRADVALSPRRGLLVDVHEFRRLARCDGQAPDAASHAGEALARAADLYRGDFLSEFRLRDSPPFEEWQFFEQERLRREYGEVLARLVDACGSSGQLDRAIENARRWLALDPLDERVHCSLMRLYGRAGRRAAALRQYEQCRSILARELNEEPSAETERLADAIRGAHGAELAAGLQSAAPARGVPSRAPARASPRSTPPVPAAPPPPNNLPEPATQLVGREKELAHLRELLALGDTRILTLTGPGGTGKTRLAVEAAREAAGRFGEGTFFIDLAPLREPAEVVPAIAAALGVRRPVGAARPVDAMLADHLRRRRVLLLLDNFEHVAAASAQVEQLLASALHARAIVTSRRSLHLAAAKEFPVPPLSVEQAAAGADALQVTRCESVRLLAERAATARPDFVVTAENAAALGEICARLDGLPLAIELAAPRLRLLTPQDLARRLADCLDLAAGPLPGAPARQQTLRRTLDWSYDLLDDGEKKLFARFAVFAGGASVDAAERVCRGGPEDADVLAGLSSLADHSLLHRDESGGETRLRMLETILEYARERLEAGGEAETAGARHAAFFLSLVEQAEPQLHGPEQMRWVARLVQEEHNCGRAMSWLLRRGKATEALRLAVALRWFHHRRGDFELGARWLEEALALPQSASLGEERARALDALGWLVFVQGDWARAHALYAEGLALARRLGARGVEAALLADLGVAERWLGSDDEGTRLCEEAVAIAREIGGPARLATSLIWAYGTTGGRPVGRSPREGLEEAVRISQRCGDLWGTAHALNSLGDFLREAGEHAEACSRYEGALRAFQELGDRWMTAWTFEGLGRALFLGGETKRGAAHLRESLSLFVRLGDRGGAVHVLGRLGMVARALGRHAIAARLLGAFKALRDAAVGGDVSTRSDCDPDEKEAFAQYQADDAWHRGLETSYEEAVDVALAEGAAAPSRRRSPSASPRRRPSGGRAPHPKPT